MKSAYRQAFVAATAVFAVYALLLTRRPYLLFGSIPSSNVFVYLADSFLKGHLNIDVHSPYYTLLDNLSIFNGQAYAYWPPLCAFLLMPAVLIHGVCLGDLWFNVLFTSVSVFAGWLTIEALGKRFEYQVSIWYKILLSAFLAFGTSFLTLSLCAAGKQWYMAQVAAAMMMSLAVTSALCIKNTTLKLLLSGSFWALAILSRVHLILAAPFFCYVAFCSTESSEFKSYYSMPAEYFAALRPSKQKFINLTLVIIPVVLVLIFFAWYNWSRFGSMFETGIKYHGMALRYLNHFLKYGCLSIHYLWHNVYYTVLRLPIFQHLFREPNSNTPHDWTEGYSLFYQSPVFLYIFSSLRFIKKDALTASLWISMLLVAASILGYMGSGWVQFGARYLFDLCPLLFPLAVIGTQGRITPLFLLLVMLSIIINFDGMRWLGC